MLSTITAMRQHPLLRLARDLHRHRPAAGLMWLVNSSPRWFSSCSRLRQRRLASARRSAAMAPATGTPKSFSRRTISFRCSIVSCKDDDQCSSVQQQKLC